MEWVHLVGASSTGKHRSPQTAPRLQGPNIGSNEPGRSPEVMLDAFRDTVVALTAIPWQASESTQDPEAQSAVALQLV